MLMRRILPVFLVYLSLLSWVNPTVCQEWEDRDNYLYQTPFAVGHSTVKLNIRAKPSINSEVIGQFYEGDRFRIILKGPQNTIDDITDWWYFVADEADIQYGWVFGAYIVIEQYLDFEE